ncbi:MAG: hypothetical protein ACFE7R_05065 [Candidatus Hodarchaeota archaeon]
MRERNLILKNIGFVIVLLIFCVPSVAAVENHGLFWGITEGQRIDYVFSSDAGDDNLEFNYYIIVGELPEIPDDVTNYQEFLTTDCQSYFVNGTPLSYYAMWLAFAVGNWPLVQQIMDEYWQTTSFSVQWISTTAAWGFAISGTDPYDSMRTTYIFSRFDGAINTLQQEVLDEDETVIESVQVFRAGGSHSSDSLNEDDSPDLVFFYTWTGISVILVILGGIVVTWRRT